MTVSDSIAEASRRGHSVLIYKQREGQVPDLVYVLPDKAQALFIFYKFVATPGVYQVVLAEKGAEARSARPLDRDADVVREAKQYLRKHDG